MLFIPIRHVPYFDMQCLVTIMFTITLFFNHTGFLYCHVFVKTCLSLLIHLPTCKAQLLNQRPKFLCHLCVNLALELHH